MEELGIGFGQEPRIPRPMPSQGRVHSSGMSSVCRHPTPPPHLPCPCPQPPGFLFLLRGRTLPRGVWRCEGGLGPLLLSSLPQGEPSLKIWGCFQSPGLGGGSRAGFGAPGRVGTRREKVGAELGDRREKVGADRLRGHMTAAPAPPRPAPAPCPARGEETGRF